MIRVSAILCLAFVFAACKSPKKPPVAGEEENEVLGPGGCGTERWGVKTGTDPQAPQVSLASPQVTTIATLAALPAPHTLPSTRIPPTETTEFTLKNVTVKEIKLEADSDYHLVLADASGATMVAEIPATNCVGASSPWARQIATARHVAEGQVAHPGPFTASLVGIGFFDNPHGQTGAAPNAIELHPTLAICVGQDCSLSGADAGETLP
jgi:hypothetical protein